MITDVICINTDIISMNSDNIISVMYKDNLPEDNVCDKCDDQGS